jgi:hypothetical protein
MATPAIVNAITVIIALLISRGFCIFVVVSKEVSAVLVWYFLQVQ